MERATSCSSNSLSREEHLKSKRAHRYMFHTFISLLILGFIHLPLNTFSLAITDSSWTIAYFRRIYMLIANVTLIGLYGFGVFVLDRRSPKGLITFTWLVVAVDVIATVAVLFLFFVSIFETRTSSYSLEIIIRIFLFPILSIAGITIMAISIKHALNLSDLINHNEQLILEQV